MWLVGWGVAVGGVFLIFDVFLLFLFAATAASCTFYVHVCTYRHCTGIMYNMYDSYSTIIR